MIYFGILIAFIFRNFRLYLFSF